MKKIAILGSTGSIGQQTLDVVRTFPEKLEVVALAAGRSLGPLAEQVREFHPRVFSFQDTGHGKEEIEDMFPFPDMTFMSLEEIASHPEVDLVVMATSGKAGIGPTLSAIRAGKTVALANKEVLVAAGEIVMAEAQKHKADILPLDSEHSAIWQCLRGEEHMAIARIILTASGGPFRHYSPKQLAAVTPEDALKHPTWQMGKKVTVDSATLMNKGMEVIEARWLFDIPLDNIEVMIHPQSIVHSMVEFVDGSVKAQLGPPDMRLPIQHALCYPDRLDGGQFPKLDWHNFGDLVFDDSDLKRFPCLQLALEAIRAGGTYPAVLSASDEIAVDLFLNHKIRLVDIPDLIRDVLDQYQDTNSVSLDTILAADDWARKYARKWRPPKR